MNTFFFFLVVISFFPIFQSWPLKSRAANPIKKPNAWRKTSPYKKLGIFRASKNPHRLYFCPSSNVKPIRNRNPLWFHAQVCPAVDAICKVIFGDTECPLQVCQLSRSSESTHFLFLRRDVALFDSTRAPGGFWDRRHVPPIYFLTFPNIKRQPYHTKPIQMISNSDTTGLSRPYLHK